MEENNKKPYCPDCVVSDETIQKLKNNSGRPESKKQIRERQMSAKMRFKKIKRVFFWAVSLLFIGVLIFWSIVNLGQRPGSGKEVTVFLSPDCGCCHEYVSYLKRGGFKVKAVETNDVISQKEKYNVPENLQGCHTSVAENYVLEGMVPIRAINQLLTEKPQIDGIDLPGMPYNAPGMPGFNGAALTVYALKDGVSSDFGAW